MKGLLFGVLLASPGVGLWMHLRTPPASQSADIQKISYVAATPAPVEVTQIPVEVISKGSAPQWVYVNVGSQAVPEPGVISLVGFTALLLVFRRQRS